MKSVSSQFDPATPSSGGANAARGALAARDVEAQALRQRELELLRQARSGDRGAFGKIVMMYQDRLYNAVLRIVGDRDEALELTQEAFTRALDKLDGFRGEATAYTWLFRIAMNLSLTRLRTVKRQRTFSLDASSGDSRGGSRSTSARARFDDQAASLQRRIAGASAEAGALSPPQELERRERDVEVLAALGRVDPDDRAILVMRDVDGMDYQQMAEVLDVPLGTLKSRLFRARLALRNELQAYFGA